MLMAYDPDELFTLADELRLLVEQGIAEDKAKALLSNVFSFRGRTIYSPKYAVHYDRAAIDFATGRVTLHRLPRQSFVPTLTAAQHYKLFPVCDVGDPARQAASAGVTTEHATAAAEPLPLRKHGPAPRIASYHEVKAAVQKRGAATESELRRAVADELPDKRVSRQWVRRARYELFGKPGRTGRPKSPNKSPE
jgi:hypothetical protein